MTRSNRTKLHNDTSFEIVLKSGNAGVWSRTGTIPIGKDYEVKSAANETYKEYWCAVQPNDDMDVILSSDDCIEFKEIVIKPTARDPAKFYWEGTVKRDGTPVAPPAANAIPAANTPAAAKTPPAANAPPAANTSPAANAPPAGTNRGLFSRLRGNLFRH